MTVLKEAVQLLPQYDYLYLGDNARVPYGSRSDWIVYEFTRQAVRYLFRQGCRLIIIACNTSSAKALRRIQQEFLPAHYPQRRVLGVVIPLAEEIVERTTAHKVGVLATEGTVASGAYTVEIQKINPSIEVYQQACPLLVPIIEAGEQDWPGTDMIIRKYLDELFAKDPLIDTILLACTHYPILYRNFVRNAPRAVGIIEQGPIVARKLKEYLSRHPEIESNLGKSGQRQFLTTDTWEKFDRLARVFYGGQIHSELVSLDSISME